MKTKQNPKLDLGKNAEVKKKKYIIVRNDQNAGSRRTLGRRGQ